MGSRSSGRDWEKIQALFGDAVERPAGERAAFLGKACEGDSELRDEVESLLRAHDQAGDFLARPPGPIPLDPAKLASGEAPEL
jgi:eukaryotic-like serine/threonine-protein kinase